MSDLVQQHLHEMAVDMTVWDRMEWRGWDRIQQSLVNGHPIPGLTRGGLISQQGLCLGWSTQTMAYGQEHFYQPCSWVSDEVVKLAEAVDKGLRSVGPKVSQHGCHEHCPDPFRRGAWGWHVAAKWVVQTKQKVILFGPMMSWHWMHNWSFVRDATTGRIVPQKLKTGQGPTNQHICY